MLTIKIPERRHWRRYVIFIVNFEHISHLVVAFLFFTLNMLLLAGYVKFNPFQVYFFFLYPAKNIGKAEIFLCFQWTQEGNIRMKLLNRKTRAFFTSIMLLKCCEVSMKELPSYWKWLSRELQQ